MYLGILARAALAAAAFLAIHPAFAQSGNFVGLGVGAVPVYEGASEYKALPSPVVNYHAGPFFISPRGGLPAMGLKTTLASNLDAGIFIGLGRGRDADDADRTRGLDNIDFHAAYGAYIEWTPGKYSLGAAYRQAAKGGYGGTLELRATYTAFTSAKHAVRIGANTQWANDDYMQTWYGVTPSQAARSEAGLPAYSASAGFKSASVFATWAYRLDQNWSTLTTVGVLTVMGDARSGPLTARKTNPFGAVALVYNF